MNQFHQAANRLSRLRSSFDISAGAAVLLDRYQRAHRLAALPQYLDTNEVVRIYNAEALAARAARHALLRVTAHVTPLRRALAASLTQGTTRAR